MTHPSGNLIFLQGGAFALPRSYVDTIKWAAEPHLGFTLVGNEFVLTYSPIPTYRAHVKVRDAFWNWSSNHYTLDHIIDWCYEQASPSDPETAALLWVECVYDETLGRSVIQFRTVSPGVEVYFPLPPRDAPYWTPDPP